jgi:hypothetical protein
VRRNDEVEAQRRRWTFYETIMISCRALSDDGDDFDFARQLDGYFGIDGSVNDSFDFPFKDITGAYFHLPPPLFYFIAQYFCAAGFKVSLDSLGRSGLLW